jgi:hypothetical protein
VSLVLRDATDRSRSPNLIPAAHQSAFGLVCPPSLPRPGNEARCLLTRAA